MTSRLSLPLFLSISTLLTTGCKESSVAAQPAPAASAATAASAALSAAQRPLTEVARVVFVDKEHACKCTQKRVDDSWAALQGALAGRQVPTVERLHADTQAEAVEPYNKMRAVLALPALYFMDTKGTLMELLQGEVTQEQIQAVLGGGTGKH